jgi:hypothetical protein
MPQTIKGQPIDQRTTALNLPLPHLDNWQDDDVPRLRGALVLLDFLIAALQAEKAGAADLNALAGELRNALGLKAGAKELQDTAAELRNALGLKAAAKDLQDIAAELRNSLGLKADANAVVKSWAGKKGDVAPVFADLGGKPNTLAGYGITDGAAKSTTLAGYGIADGAKRLPPEFVSAPFTAQDGGVYLCATGGGPFYAFMPANPRIGSIVTFIDMDGAFDAYPLTLNGNGNPFYFQPENYVLDQKGQGRTFIYYNSALGWTIYV